MYVKKNLMLWVAVLALALPLLLTGTASAKYIGDGAAPDGAGGWKAPNDGICVLSIDINGNLVTDPSILTRKDCEARLVDVTAVTSNAAQSSVCGTPSANTAGVKYAAPGGSTCVTIDGNGYITGAISMAGLDRNAVICNGLGGQLANATAPATLSNGAVITTATRTTANGTAAKCLAYGWQFRGQDAAGAPLAFGAEGTDAATGAGFCYTTMRTGDTICPSTSTDPMVKYGYSVSGANCVYSYGINGPVNAAMTKIDGTSYAAAGNVRDLSLFTTQGDCLANGGTWNNWVTKNGTITATNGAILAAFDLTRQTGASTEGCLHCHSYSAQYNGPAERYKESYLKTGHKNMLRKVTAGKPWSGPDTDGVLANYTSWGANGVNTIDWNAATTTVSGVTSPLLYIFGDWMAPAPDGLDVVNWKGTTASYNNGSSYSCAACHTTGWSNNATTTAGLCNYSSKTTQATCEAVTSGDFGAGVWTPMTGVMGATYNPVQPGESFPAYRNADNTITGITGRWDLDGIQCSRCHEGDATQGTHHSKPIFADKAGEAVINLCFGCHQSIAKISNGTGADADLANPTAIPVKNAATAPAYTPMFSGHVLGGEFLNSPHARFTGSITPNSLGKYDINAGGTYNSNFKGFMCYQSPTSGSPAMTKADGHHIETKAECEGLYGAGSWRPDTRGSCASCHDVHNSLFVAGQHGLRKECVSCHDNSTYATDVPGTTQASVVNHPTGAGTPSGVDPADPCIVCHMPKPTGADFPMHVWRINSDVNYSTFPTAAEFGIGATATKKIANTAVDNKGYANAVWVDLDLSCGQCHGASGSAHLMTKTGIAPFAQAMHGSGSAPTTDCATCHATAQGSAVAITPGVTHHTTATACNVCHTGRPGVLPTVDCTTCHTQTINHPEAANAVLGATLAERCQTCHMSTGNYAGVKPTSIQGACGQCHGGNSTTTANGAPYKNLLELVALAKVFHSSNTPPTPVMCDEPANIAPVAAHTISQAGNTVTFTDASTDDQAFAAGAVTVNWGDGTISTGNALGVFTHTYATINKTFTIKHSVKDAGVQGTMLNADGTACVPKLVPIAGTTPTQYTTTPVMVNVLAASEAPFTVAITLAKFDIAAVAADAAGNVINGATIALRVNGKHTKSLQKGTNGTYTFNVPAGKYSISAWAPGYKAKNGAVFTLSTNGTYTVTLTN